MGDWKGGKAPFLGCRRWRNHLGVQGRTFGEEGVIGSGAASLFEPRHPYGNGLSRPAP